MKRKITISLPIALVLIGFLAVTYRAPVVDAAINAIRQLKIDLADGDIPIAASSTELADGKILIGNSSGKAEAQSMSGDVGISNAGVAFIATSSVVNADVAGDAGIEFSKFETLSSTKFLVGNASGVATDVVMSGDATMDNAGAVTIGAGTVETAMLESGLQPSHVVKYAGFANWSGYGKTTYVPIVGALTTDVMQATPKTAQASEGLQSAYIYSNNTAVFNLYTGEINSKSWQYTVYRAAP
jgi:hypothetical protein